MKDQPEYDDYIEIDLRKYMLLLWQKRFLIISIVIIAVLISFLVSTYLLEKEYRAISTVRIGNGGPTIYTEPGEVKNLLKSRSFLNETGMSISKGMVNSMVQEDDSTLQISFDEDSDFVNIIVTTNEADLSAELANSIANSFVERGSRVVKKERVLIENYRSRLLEKKENNEELDSKLDYVLEKFDSIEEEEMFASSYLMKTIIELQESINERDLTLEERVYSLEKSLMNLESPQIMSEAEIPDNHVSPNVKLNVAIAFVLSLMAGIFIVPCTRQHPVFVDRSD